MDKAHFDFLDPGPLVDEELELVEPSQHLVAPLLAAIRHPLTQRHFPAERSTTRDDLLRFLDRYPRGRQPADPQRGIVPAYHFWMRLKPQAGAEIEIAGGIGLRIGNTPHIVLYAGHIGYHVYPPARGRHLARRATALLLPLARRHGITDLWITTNPDNIPSRRTCEGLGATLVETVAVPPDDPLYARGERHKCRYLIRL